MFFNNATDDVMFKVFPIIFIIVFIIIFGVIVFGVISSIKQGVKNNYSPRLTVSSKVMSKRIHVHGDNSQTTYYVTFEVQSGDRMEFRVDGTEYGMLVEQDTGLLTFQGTRYISFERQL